MNVIENLRDLACSAHMGTSWQPESRGDFFVKEYSGDLQNLLNEIPFEHRDWVTEKYVKLLSAWWYAKSRCISPMIAGPANFPTARAQKLSNWERGHFDAFYEWRNSIARKLERKAARENWTAEGEIHRLENELDILKSNQERMKAANKILFSKKMSEEEQLDELQNLGFHEVPKIAFLNKKGFAQYELTSVLNKIKGREARIAELNKRIQARELVPNETVRDGVRIVENVADNRLQLFFPYIPSEKVRKQLRHHGFRWSPVNKCWQSYLSGKCELEKVFELL